MSKSLYFISILLILTFSPSFSQEKVADTQNSGTQVYLLTINPGIETYSHYGHSALRIVIPERKFDIVYNWGVFYFNTSNFAWKFAKGKLDYMLDASSYKNFISQYIDEQRSVYQQEVKLTPEETDHLLSLISENLKPENVRYRYDFFYDDCSTRIRDLFEKVLGKKLIYPQSPEKKYLPTFRAKVAEYQKGYPWLQTGIDLLFGLSTNKKATLRDQMFLPFDLQGVLSESTINRGNKTVPLLTNVKVILEYPLPVIKRNVLLSPLMILSLLLILTIVFSATIHGKTANKVADIILFTAYSVLSGLMIFFNFFSDHEQLKWNMNIIWLNPFVILCLISLIFDLNRYGWFRIVFFLAVLMLIPMFFIPAAFNNAFVPLCLILILRSSSRSEFGWNPFSLKTDELS